MRYLMLAAALLLVTLPAAAQEKAFAPSATVSLAVTATTGRVQIQSGSNSPHARLYNGGAGTVFVNCGGDAVVATTAAGMPVPAGVVEVIACPQPYIAALTASGTSTLYITVGSGI